LRKHRSIACAFSGMPSFFTSGNTATVIGAISRMEAQHDPRVTVDLLLA
jgi:hypothetical protein